MMSSMEDALNMALNENTELKEKLRKLENQQQRIVDEKNVSIAKVSELQEIVDAKCQTDIEKSLLEKSLRNAELAFQVEKLHVKLQEERTNILKMAQERESKKRMLLELSDIVRTLQSVAISYSMDEKEVASTRPEDMALSNIKRKIAAIMQDRAKLIDQCSALRAENESKDMKVAALEAHFHVINAVNTDAISTTSGLTERQSAAASMSDHSTVPTTLSFEESEASSPSVARSSDQSRQEVARLKNQLIDAEQRYVNLKLESKKVVEIMSNIDKRMKTSILEASEACKKRDQYRDSLQDVINQYKDLQAQHEECHTELESMTMELNIFRLEKDLLQKEKERLGLEAQHWKPAYIYDLRGDDDALCEEYEEAVNHIRVLERRVTLLVQEAGVLKKQKVNQANALRDAIFNHRRLERDFGDLTHEMVEVKDKMELIRKEEHKHREQAKHARRRLTTTTQQVKKLQEELEVTLGSLLEAKAANQKAANRSGWSEDALYQMMLVELRATSIARIKRQDLYEEKQQLLQEHKAMKACSEDILTELSAIKKTEDPNAQVDAMRKKLVAKESDMRDVIGRYRRLEKKYSTLVARVKSASKGFGSKQTTAHSASSIAVAVA